MAEPRNLGDQAISKLGLPEEAQAQLRAIQDQVNEAYREAFIEVTTALRKQASALDRIQATLGILVEQLRPQLSTSAEVPVALRLADSEDEAPDVATALVLADPIASGYTLTQAELARLVGISASDLSILVRAFKLTDDPNAAVTVRQGRQRAIVNYHRRAVARMKALIQSPGKLGEPLSKTQANALRRARAKLGLG